MARHFEKCKHCPPRSSRDLRIKIKPKNPKILKVLLNSQFSRYRRKILYTETCTQALADVIAKHRHFHHLTLKLRSRSFSCLLYTSPSPRDGLLSRMPSSA